MRARPFALSSPCPRSEAVESGGHGARGGRRLLRHRHFGAFHLQSAPFPLPNLLLGRPAQLITLSYYIKLKVKVLAHG